MARIELLRNAAEAGRWIGWAKQRLANLKRWMGYLGLKQYQQKYVLEGGTDVMVRSAYGQDLIRISGAPVTSGGILIFFWFVSTENIGVLLLTWNPAGYTIRPYRIYLGDAIDHISHQSTLLVCQSDSTQKIHKVAYPNPPFTNYNLTIRRYGAWLLPLLVGNSSCFVPPWVEGYDETYQEAYATPNTYASRHPYTLDTGLLVKWDISVYYSAGSYEKTWKTIGTGDGWTLPLTNTEPFTLPANSTYSTTITGSEYVGSYPHVLYYSPYIYCDIYTGTVSYIDSDAQECALSDINIDDSGTAQGTLICMLGDSPIYETSDTTTTVLTNPEAIGTFTATSTASAELSVRYLSAEDEDACNNPNWLSGVCTGTRVTTNAYNFSATRASTSRTQHNKYYLGGELFKTLSSTYSGESYANAFETSYEFVRETTVSGPNVAECWGVAQIECDPGDCSGCVSSFINTYTELDVTKTGMETETNRSLSFLDYDHTWDGSVVFVLYVESVQTVSRETDTRFYWLEGGSFTEEITDSRVSTDTIRTYYVAVKVDGVWYTESLGNTEPEEFSCQLNSKCAVFTYMLGAVRKMGIFNVDPDNQLDLGYYQEFGITEDSLRAINEDRELLEIDINDYAVIGAHFHV